MNRFLRLFAAAFFLSTRLGAQCPVILNCPASPGALCDHSANDPKLWNENYWLDPATGLHDLSDAPTPLVLRALDTCSNAGFHISYVLRLDLDRDGSWETAVYSDSLNPANTVFYNNLNVPGGIPRAFDERPVPDPEKYRFALELGTAGDTTLARIRWNTETAPDIYVDPQLPDIFCGVQWKVHSNIGGAAHCAYPFTTRDCAPPTTHCLPGLSVDIPPVKAVQIWATDMLLYAEDNQTPASQLAIGIRKAGSGSGFPLAPNGTPVQSVWFECDELGPNTIELWSLDLAGNADSCTAEVFVHDNPGYCVDWSPYTCIKQYCSGTGLAGVSIEIQGTHPSLPPLSLFTHPNDNGCASLEGFPLLGSYRLHPSKDNDPPGATLEDAARVARHLDGSEPFTDPYQWIAADVNRDAVVDSVDILEIIQVASGAQTQWSNNQSWRFVPFHYVFLSPNPLADSIPSTININSAAWPTGLDFVAVRIGDVDACVPVTTGEAAARILRAGIQPNPTAGGAIFHVQISQTTPLQLEIFDLNGRAVFRAPYPAAAGRQAIEVPASAFPGPGVYSWRLQAGQEVSSGKVIRL